MDTKLALPPTGTSRLVGNSANLASCSLAITVLCLPPTGTSRFVENVRPALLAITNLSNFRRLEQVASLETSVVQPLAPKHQPFRRLEQVASLETQVRKWK